MMRSDSKICSSCGEKNNPDLRECWKCGYDFASGRISELRKLRGKRPGKIYEFLPVFWVSLIFHGLYAFYRDFIETKKYPTPEDFTSDAVSATLGLLTTAFVSAVIFYILYLIILSNRKK